MTWNGEEYSRRLEALSDDTMRILAKLNTTKSISKAADIIMTTDSETEVAKELLKIKAEQKAENQ